MIETTTEALIAELRKYSPHDPGVWPCHEAAGEIERLCSRVAELERWQETVRSNSPLLAELEAVKAERDDADRRAGRAERTMEGMRDELRRLQQEVCRTFDQVADGKGKALSSREADALAQSVYGWADHSSVVLVRTTEAFMGGSLQVIPSPGGALLALDSLGIQVRTLELVEKPSGKGGA